MKNVKKLPLSKIRKISICLSLFAMIYAGLSMYLTDYHQIPMNRITLYATLTIVITILLFGLTQHFFEYLLSHNTFLFGDNQTNTDNIADKENISDVNTEHVTNSILSDTACATACNPVDAEHARIQEPEFASYPIEVEGISEVHSDLMLCSTDSNLSEAMSSAENTTIERDTESITDTELYNEEQKEILEACKEYTKQVMKQHLSPDNLNILLSNLEYYASRKFECYKALQLKANSQLTTSDIKAYTWNMGARLKIRLKDSAFFLTAIFPNEMQNLSIVSLTRNLKTMDSKIIPIDEPDKDDYKFHYE